MGISFDPSWNPRDDWKNWEELPWLGAFYNNSKRPNDSTDPTWVEGVLAATLDAKPAARDAIWQSVVAIWSLKQIRERTVETEVWRHHLMAWMVRWLSESVWPAD